MYTSLCTDHPIDLCAISHQRIMVDRLNLLRGRLEKTIWAKLLKQAVINKRAGGMRLDIQAQSISEIEERGSGASSRDPRCLSV